MNPVTTAPTLTDPIFQAVADGICRRDLLPGTHLNREEPAHHVLKQREISASVRLHDQVVTPKLLMVDDVALAAQLLAGNASWEGVRR